MADIVREVQYTVQVTGAGEAQGAVSGLAEQFALGGVAANLMTQAINTAKNAIIQLVRDSIEATQVIEDLQGAMAYVYTTSAPGLISSLDQISESTGFARTVLYDTATSIGAMIVPMGVAEEEAANMASTLTMAAADVAAALGKDLGEAASIVEGAMRGNARSARQLGIDLSQAAVDAELLAMGIEGGARAASDAQIIQARYNLIIEATGRYSGAAAEEMTTLEGAIRNQGRVWENLAQTIGDAIKPELTDNINSIASTMENLTPIIGAVVEVVASLLDIAVGPLIDSFENASAVVNLAVAALTYLNDIIEENIPFARELGEVWDWMSGINSDASEIIEQWTADLYASAEATDIASTASFDFGNYLQALTEKLGPLNIAQLEYVQLLLSQANIMGVLDPQMAEVQGRIDELQAQLDNVNQGYWDALQAKKEDTGVTTGTGGTGTGDPEKQIIKYQEEKVRLTKVLSAEQQRLNALKLEEINRVRQMREEYDRNIQQAAIAAKEEARAFRESVANFSAEALGGVASQMITDFSQLDDFVLNMIKRWAAELAAAFAIQGVMSAFGMGGGGGFLSGAFGKFLGGGK